MVKRKQKPAPEKIEKSSDTEESNDEEESEAEQLPENLSESDEEEPVVQTTKKSRQIEKIKLDNFPNKADKLKKSPVDPVEPKPKQTPKKAPKPAPESEDASETGHQKIRKSIPENTIFVGNLANNTKIKQLKAHFKPYGDITSVWFRSENGKKIMNKSDRKKYSSLIAYISFQDHDSAVKAVKEQNGQVFKENHLRVDLKAEKQEKFGQDLNKKSTVFVGNVKFEATDEDLRQFFTEKCGEVDYVRRLPKKGVAFVCFKKGTPIVRALKLNDEDFQGRKLRVTKWEPKETIQKKEKKLIKKGKKKPGTAKQLDTSRPTNNPLIKKIKEKKKVDTTVDKAEFKKQFRDNFRDGVKKEEKKAQPIKFVKPEVKEKPKAKTFAVRKPVEKKKRSKPQSSLTKKKKKEKVQKLKKVAKFLTGKKR